MSLSIICIILSNYSSSSFYKDFSNKFNIPSPVLNIKDIAVSKEINAPCFQEAYSLVVGDRPGI